MRIANPFRLIGALSGAIAVTAGAIGAHVLRREATDQQIEWLSTAADFQLYHALALLIVGHLAATDRRAPLRLAAWLFVVGTILFCGSLYSLALGADRVVAAAAPFGGASLIAGWILLAASAVARGRLSRD